MSITNVKTEKVPYKLEVSTLIDKCLIFIDTIYKIVKFGLGERKFLVGFMALPIYGYDAILKK